MARSVSSIQASILDSVSTDPVLSVTLTSQSKRAVYLLWSYITAVAINILENLIDVFTAAVEAIATTAAPGTAPWLIMWVNQFQYSATNPQIIQFTPQQAPYYPVVDTTLRIISRVSVNTDLANNVIVKVATGSTPAALSSLQLTSLQAFIQPPNGIGIAGVNYTVISQEPDLLYCQANIYYNGQYAAVIQAAVIAGINNYLATIPFNGQLRLSDFEIAIRNVTGVTDVLFVNVSARDVGTSFGSGTPLVTAQDVVARLYSSVAGYIIGETTGGNTFADTLTFIPG
jgi:hypothetical protein